MTQWACGSMLAVGWSDFEIFDSAILRDAGTALHGAVSGNVLVGLLPPMGHRIGRDVNGMCSEQHAMCDGRIDCQRGVEHRTRIMDGVKQRLESRGPLLAEDIA